MAWSVEQGWENHPHQDHHPADSRNWRKRLSLLLQIAPQWTQALKRVGSVVKSVAHKHMTAYQNLVYYCKARHIPNPTRSSKPIYIQLNNTGKKKFRDFHSGWNNGWELRLRSFLNPTSSFGRTHQWSRSLSESRNFSQMIKRLNDELGMTILISSRPLWTFIWLPTALVLSTKGAWSKKLTSGFEEQEDYIILKTSQLGAHESTDSDRLHHRIKGHR